MKRGVFILAFVLVVSLSVFVVGQSTSRGTAVSVPEGGHLVIGDVDCTNVKEIIGDVEIGRYDRVQSITLETGGDRQEIVKCKFGNNEILELRPNAKVSYKRPVIEVLTEKSLFSYSGLQLGHPTECSNVKFEGKKIFGGCFSLVQKDIFLVKGTGDKEAVLEIREGGGYDISEYTAVSSLISPDYFKVSAQKPISLFAEKGTSKKEFSGILNHGKFLRIENGITEGNILFSSSDLLFSVGEDNNIWIYGLENPNDKTVLVKQTGKSRGKLSIDNGPLRFSFVDGSIYVEDLDNGKEILPLVIETCASEMKKESNVNKNRYKITSSYREFPFYCQTGVVSMGFSPIEDQRSLKKEFPSVKFPNIEFWSSERLGDIRSILLEVSSELPGIFKSLKSLNLDIAQTTGACGVASGGNIILRVTGIYCGLNKKSTLIHELSHLKHFLLTEQTKFDDVWKSIAGDVYLKGCKLDKWGIRCVSWEGYPQSYIGKWPLNGCIKPYGCTNILEDVATMNAEANSYPKEVLKDARENESGRIKRKIALLCECGFTVKKALCEDDLIKSVEKTGVCDATE